MGDDVIREYVNEVVKASPSYMKKEEIRQVLQDLIAQRVKNRSIKNQKDLNAFFADVDMAANALKSIPIEVFKKL